MRTAPVLITLTAILMLLSGCSSSFVGHKLGPMRDKQNPIVKTGIPVTMNRPEFQLTVTKEKAGNKEQLVSTIAVKWVPDNAQRYTLSLDPALFTKSSFTHTFDQDGNFAAGEGSLESQVVATIATLGELARSFQNLPTYDAAHPMQMLRETIEDSKAQECMTTHQSDLFTSYPPISNETVGAVIANRWKTYRDVGERVEKGGGDVRVLERIHFTSQQERECFNAVRKNIEEANSKDLTKLKENFDKLHAEFKSKFESHLSFKIANDEIVKLKKVHDHVALTNLYKKLSDETSENLDGEEFGNSRRQLVQMASRIARKESNQFSIAVLDAILHMRPSVWRARQALELSRRIEGIAVEGSQYPHGSVRTGYENFGKALKAELDHILGTTHTTTQIANLEAYLAKEVPLLAGANVQRYAVDERAKVASQLEALRTARTNAKSLVIGKNEPISEGMSLRPLPEPDPCNCPSLPGPTAELELVSNLVIPTADAGFVKLTGKKLLEEVGNNPPPYVLVIEQTNGSPKLMPPKKSDTPAEGE